jgi:CheY-like chemotaxis protein
MPHPVLYVEDEPDDVFFMQRAFTTAQVAHPLHIAGDGQVAIDYLSALKETEGAEAKPLPSLVLLDLNLPRVHGLEVLRWIRSQERLRWLPVAIFSSSLEKRDIEAAYALGANSYLVKPSAFDELKELARIISEYWLRRNQVASAEEAAT